MGCPITNYSKMPSPFVTSQDYEPRPSLVEQQALRAELARTSDRGRRRQILRRLNAAARPSAASW